MIGCPYTFGHVFYGPANDDASNGILITHLDFLAQTVGMENWCWIQVKPGIC